MRLKIVAPLVALALTGSLVAAAGEMPVSHAITAESAVVLTSVKINPPLPNPDSPYPPLSAQLNPPLPNPDSPYPPLSAQLNPPLPNPDSPYPPLSAQLNPPLPNPDSPYPPLA